MSNEEEKPGLDVVVLVRAADKEPEKTLGAIGGKQCATALKARPVGGSWNDTCDPTHTVLQLGNCRLDDLNFLRAQTRDGKIATWLVRAGSVDETLGAVGLTTHKLA